MNHLGSNSNAAVQRREPQTKHKRFPASPSAKHINQPETTLRIFKSVPVALKE